MIKTTTSGQFGSIKDGRKIPQNLKKNGQLTELESFLKHVKDSFIKTFLDLYGTKVDYNSVVASLKFESSNVNGVIMPSFSFDESKLVFLDELNIKENFDLSSYEDFLTNEGLIAGEYYSDYDILELSYDSDLTYDDYEEGTIEIATEFTPTRVNYLLRLFKSIRDYDKENIKLLVILTAIQKAKLK